MQSALSLKLKPTMVHRPVLAPKAKPKAKPKKYADGGTTSTQYVSNILPGSEGAYGQLVQNSQDLTDLTKTPYQPYEGERTAAFTPLQNQGYAGIAALGPSAQSTQAGGIAGLAANQALGSTYNPNSFSTYGAAPAQVTQPGGPQMTSTQSFLQPGTAGAYMNPYQQQVTDIAKREATRADDVARTGRNAQAVGAGAFGGSRQAIVESEANRNLQQHLGDIQAQGSDAAFKQAQAQFNAEQGLGLQSQTANQKAGLDTTQMGQQAQIANQGAGLQYGNQYLDAQKLAEASKQFGANYGLEGLKTGISGATALSGVGNDLFKQGYTSATGQAAAGADQRAAIQQDLDTKAAEYEKQQLDPYKRLGFMSDILHGTQGAVQNVTGSTTSTVPQASNMQNLVGLGLGLYGATKAKGGVIESGIARIAPDDVGDFADGGIVGYAGGGTSTIDWSMFDTPSWSRAQGPRPMPGNGAGMAQAEALTAEAAEREAMKAAAAKAAARKLGARVAGPLAPVAGAGYDMYESVKNPRAVDKENPSLWSDTKAGVADLLKYMPGVPAQTARAYLQYGHEKPTPEIPKLDPMAAPDVEIDAGAVKPADYSLSGSARFGGGAPRVTAPAAPTLEQLLADQKTAGVDYDAHQKQGIESLNNIAAADKAAAEADAADVEARIAKRGVAGADREKKLQGRLDEMGGRTERAKGDAMMQAGLAILSADPRRGWLAAVGSGAAQGLAQYRGDEKELRLEKAKLDDSMDALQEMRRQEADADEGSRGAARKAVRAAEVTAKRQMGSYLDNAGLAKLKGRDELFNTYVKLRSDADTRQLHADTTNATLANATGIAQLHYGILGAGAGGAKPLTEAQLESAIEKEAKARPFDVQTGKMLSRDEARAQARAAILRDRARNNTPYSLTSPGGASGWSFQTQPN